MITATLAPAADEARARLVAGLRALADWYESHPAAPTPERPIWQHCVRSNDPDGTRVIERLAAELEEVLAVDAAAGHLRVRRRFGGVEFEAFRVSPEAMALHRQRASYERSVVVDVGPPPAPPGVGGRRSVTTGAHQPDWGTSLDALAQRQRPLATSAES